jgi:hypothetical protein
MNAKAKGTRNEHRSKALLEAADYAAVPPLTGLIVAVLYLAGAVWAAGAGATFFEFIFSMAALLILRLAWSTNRLDFLGIGIVMVLVLIALAFAGHAAIRGIRGYFQSTAVHDVFRESSRGDGD